MEVVIRHGFTSSVILGTNGEKTLINALKYYALSYEGINERAETVSLLAHMGIKFDPNEVIAEILSKR